MSDNNLDIRARLTADDKLSPTVVKLLAKIKSLEEQMKKLGKAGSSIDSIPMENYVKSVNKAGRSLNGLTKKHYDWAKDAGVHTNKAALGWGKLTNKIIDLKEQHEKYVNSHKRGHATMAKNIEKQLRNEYKNAVAFRYLYNKSNDDRIGMHRRMTEQLSNLEAAHLRNEQRRHRAHLGDIRRMRQDALRGMSSMSQFGGRALPYAAAAAGATGLAGASAFKARMRFDSAETRMQIFGGLNKDQVKQMRSSWGDKDAIKYGVAPDKMMDAYTEVLKAGIDDKIAKAVTESIMNAATGLDMDTVQATKLAGTAATLFGDMKNLDPKKITSIMNAIAIAARDSKADANEIVAANKRGGSVMAMGMSMEDLSAFTAGGISGGIQQGKAGTFMDHIVSELMGAKFMPGKRGSDLGKAANLLGLGGKQGLSIRMAADPTGTLMKMLDKVGGMKPMEQQQIAHLIGQDEWSGEFLQMVQVREKIHELLKNIADPKNANYNEEAAQKQMKSLGGRWRSLTSAFGLVWGGVGAGLEKAFGQISDFFIDYLGRLDVSKIADTIEAFTDGIVAGMGYGSWSDMLKAAFGDPETVKGYSKQVFGFVKGFVAEMKRAVTIVSDMLAGVAKSLGVNDPEAAGKFTAQLLELVVALKAIGTVAGYLETFVNFIRSVAGIMTTVGLAVADVRIPNGSVKQKGETTTQWRERQQKLKELRNYKTPSDADPMFQPTSYTGATDFSGRRRSSDLSDNLNKFTGKVERAAFINSGLGGLQYAAAGGSGRGLSGSGGGGGGGFSGGLIGGVPSLLKSTPGEALPNFGVGRSGSIISRDRISGADKAPSIGASPGGIADMSVGQGLAGNQFLAARRAKFGEELKNDPNLRLHLAAMQMTEGASRGGTIESLMNRSDMQGKSMRQMLGYSADGRINPKSFYGPIRRGELGPAIEKLRRNPKLFAQYDAYTNGALSGSHAIGGYTDQGLPTDPNGSARTGIPGLRLRDPKTGKRDGNEFTDWAGAGRQKAINFRHFLEKGIAGSSDSPIGNVPSVSDTIKNVPMPGTTTPGVGAGDIRSSGPVAIHINGSSHDPEALATLVQRRVDESMNWRTHDTSSEYT